MDTHTLKILEFDKVRDKLATLASTDLGKALAYELEPGTVVESVRYDLRETSEMRSLWEINREPPLGLVRDIAESLRRSRVPGAILLPEEMLDVASSIEAADRIRNALREIKEKAEHISHYGIRLIPHPEVAEKIHSVVDEFAQVRDGASPQLNRLRRDIRELRAGIVRRLERMMRGHLKEYLVEKIYTLREDRYVLPIDARYKNKVAGILHDRSASGTTVYIEPMQIVQDGNRLKDLRREDEMETRRILRELTQFIGETADDLQSNQGIFAQLDFLGAKARYSILLDMVEPKLVPGGSFDIRNARHPLLAVHLGAKNVIPLNLSMESDWNGLILSGPNTGGKTVVLKTIGILCLMAQSGLHIPAQQETELPWFTDIGADIGDEQSLEQNLSTFSSHMMHIRALLDRAKPGMLILLDEFGSGTDPIEGGALATSILQALVDSGVDFVVTTHLDSVKVFAHNCEKTTNGAMDFNEETLMPTYRFNIGLPGRSNAIRIAQRLGLPETVIERAVQNHQDGAAQPEELLHRLSAEIKDAEANRQLAAEELTKAVRVREESRRQLQKANNQARDIIERGQKKAQGLLQELERRLEELEEVERRFRDTWKKRLDDLAAEAAQKPEPQSALKTIQEGLDHVREEMKEKPPAPTAAALPDKDIPAKHLKPGVHVELMGLGGSGEILAYNKKRDEVEVVVNGLNIRVSRKRIDRILDKPQKDEEHVPQVSFGSGSEVPMEIDIHGMTREDAEPIVLRYLDQAYRTGHPYVSVCHGAGFGVLRKMVRDMVQKLKYVRKFRNGLDHEGGNGVTIVTFRDDI